MEVLTGYKAFLALENLVQKYPGNFMSGASIFNTIRSSVNQPNQPYHAIIENDSQFSELVDFVSANTDTTGYAKLEQRARTKWVFPQGGSIATNTLFPKVLESYLNANQMIHSTYEQFKREMDLAVESVCPQLLEEMRLHELLDVSSKTTLVKYCYQPRGGFAAWDGAFRRNKFDDYIDVARTWSPHQSILSYPAFVGARFKDNKYRTIYMTCVREMLNCTYAIGPVLDFLSQSSFTRHRSDADVEDDVARVTQRRSSMCCCSDYESMDTHYTVTVAEYCFRWYAEHLGMDCAKINIGVTYIRNAFKQTAIVDWDYIITGLHCLFSGLPMTHEIENGINLLIHIRAIWLTGLRLHKRLIVKPLSLSQQPEDKGVTIYLEVNGDDSAAIINQKDKRSLSSIASIYSQYHAEVAHQYGFEIELSKTVISSDYMDYCKRLYFFGNSRLRLTYSRVVNGNKVIVNSPRSAYSLCKTLNAIYHPENIPTFSDKKLVLLWFCQIYDCAYGHPLWHAVLQALCKTGSPLRILKSQVMPSEVQQLELSFLQESNDWSLRLNNQHFKLLNSPTWEALTHIVA